MDHLTIALAQASHLRGIEKLLLRQAVRDEADLLAMSLADQSALVGRRLRSLAWEPRTLLARAETLVRDAERRRWACTVLEGPRFPRLLGASVDPPFVLWWTSEPPPADSLWLAVVGTRSPSEAGRRAAHDIGRECAEWRVGHVSGLAYGIDAAGHGGVTSAGGRSIAVLPGSLDCVAPRGNVPLARRILERGGWLVSEYPAGTLAAPWRFVARNRIIAAMAPALVVVEAPCDSGALISARFALEDNREVLVHPRGLEGSKGEGTRRLREEGAGLYEGMGGIVRGHGSPDS